MSAVFVANAAAGQVTLPRTAFTTLTIRQIHELLVLISTPHMVIIPVMLDARQ